jgi:AraC family transcriptional regulator
VAGFILTEARFPANLALPPHCHENAFFRLIIEGASTDISARRTFPGGAGTMVYHPAGERHANRWHEAGRSFVIELAADSPGRLRKYPETLGRSADFPSGAAVQSAVRVFREFQDMDAVSPLALEGLTLELLAAVCRSSASGEWGGPPGWLRRARELLHGRFIESLSLGEVAAAVGVHPGHLVRMFRRHYRCTPGAYVRRLRVEQACRELCGGDRPLAAIALAAGFSDQSHFSSVFKRHTGLTPAEYRKTFQTR